MLTLCVAFVDADSLRFYIGKEIMTTRSAASDPIRRESSGRPSVDGITVDLGSETSTLTVRDISGSFDMYPIYQPS